MSTVSEHTNLQASGSAPERRDVRIGTVVWGFIIIGVAVLFFLGSQWDLGRFNPALVTAWTILGVGSLAVMGGLVAALLRSRT